MKYLKIAFIFGLVLMISAGCSKEEIQPDPLNETEEAAFKRAKEEKARRGHQAHKLVPFKANFDLVAKFDGFRAVKRIDMVTPWPTFHYPPGAMHIVIEGSGNATHLGKTELIIKQWWTRQHTSPPEPPPPPLDKLGYWSYGQGFTTFYAANGDELYATYWGWADHWSDGDGTEIKTHGTFIGGTGRFEGATGFFLWEGVFKKDFMPVPPTEGIPGSGTPIGTEFGAGTVTVSGSISFNNGRGNGHHH